MFVDAPPTGAPAGRLDKLEPSPLKDVAVTTPAMTAPLLPKLTPIPYSKMTYIISPKVISLDTLAEELEFVQLQYYLIR